MIQFNLLPDVKIEFIKARRAKRAIMLISAVSAGAALTVLIVLFAFVSGAQKKHITDLTKDIKKYNAQLQGTTDLNKILTIQNQLSSLTGLHDKKPVTTRVFGYIASLTPNAASITKFNIDFAGGTISIVGNADTLSTVNKFADTLKFTTYTTVEPKTPTKAFSNVVLSNFTRDDKSTTYKLEMAFDPVIFDSKTNVFLSVPNIISTRSETEKPSALFTK